MFDEAFSLIRVTVPGFTFTVLLNTDVLRDITYHTPPSHNGSYWNESTSRLLE